jgi:hypothetical protein
VGRTSGAVSEPVSPELVLLSPPDLAEGREARYPTAMRSCPAESRSACLRFESHSTHPSSSTPPTPSGSPSTKPICRSQLAPGAAVSHAHRGSHYFPSPGSRVVRTPVLSRDTNSRPVARTGRCDDLIAGLEESKPAGTEGRGRSAIRPESSLAAATRSVERTGMNPVWRRSEGTKAQRRSEPRLNWKADPKADRYSVNLAKSSRHKKRSF